MILTMIEAIQWQKPAPKVLRKKRCFLEILQIHRKTPVPEPRF